MDSSYDLLVQLVEQRTVNPYVTGSSPVWVATFILDQVLYWINRV